MFTGLIEDTGRVVSLRRSSTGGRLAVRSSLEGLAKGDSISVNGVCQTIIEARGGIFSCDVLAETLRVTNLRFLRSGESVNLERALRPDSRMGGHIVNGHVDGVGEITSISRNPLGIEISVGSDIFKYIVAKGSVAVDGISLTIGPGPSGGRFRVFIIPHTWESTNLKNSRVGGKVNIEVDILGKYMHEFMKSGGRERPDRADNER